MAGNIHLLNSFSLSPAFYKEGVVFGEMMTPEHLIVRQALTANPSAIMASVQELFRRFGLVVIARMVREDIEYRGVTLKAGEMVCFPTQVHGLDDNIHADPMSVDFARKLAHHSAFGSGPHMCPGQELARAEVAITIAEWLKRIPEFRIAGDADTSISGGIVAQVNRLVLEWDAN